MKKYYVQVALCISIIMGTLSFNANAAKGFDTGLNLGVKAPQLQVIDANSVPQTLEILSGEKGLVLVFFRSADWCPFCKRHLIEINDWVKPLEAKGYKVAAISYDNTDTLRAFAKAKNISYPLLSDNDVATVKSFKVLNTDYKPGDDAYGIPFPGAYIIDVKGVVKFKYFFEGYKKRVTLEKITAVLGE